MSTPEFNIPTLSPISSIKTNTAFIVYDPTSIDLVKHKNTTMLDITNYLTSNMVFSDGVKLSADRKSDVEGLPFATNATGWWTIAVSIGSINTAKGEFHLIEAAGRGMGCRFGCRSGGVLSRPSSYIEILEDYHDSTANPYIKGFRLIALTSDFTVGFALQAYLLTGRTFTPQLLGNLGRPGFTGMTLITPVNDNTLPGGGVADNFLVAGEEFKVNLSGTSRALYHPHIVGRVGGTDIIDFTVTFREKCNPNATSVNITVPTTLCRAYDNAENFTTLTGGTYSALTFLNDYTIVFRWTEAGITTGLTGNKIDLLMQGTSFVVKLV